MVGKVDSFRYLCQNLGAISSPCEKVRKTQVSGAETAKERYGKKSGKCLYRE